MLDFPKWKIWSIMLTLVVGLAFAVPNFFSEATVATWPSWVPHKQLNLGLDLRGGSHILLEVDSNSVKKDKLDQVRDDVRRTLRDAKIGYTGLTWPRTYLLGKSQLETHFARERQQSATAALAQAKAAL